MFWCDHAVDVEGQTQVTLPDVISLVALKPLPTCLFTSAEYFYW